MSICYRDRAFCTADCGTKDCQLKLTQKVRDDAKAFGLPVAYADMRQECGVYTKNEVKA